MRRLAVAVLDRLGFHATALADERDVGALIRSLAPVETDRGLIRLGPQGDGGYLVPDDLDGIEACFSPGVSLVSGFERACAERGMKVFLADASVEGPAEPHPAFHFAKKFVGAVDDDRFMTMDAWVSASLPDTRSDLLLQMDIESGEYEALLAISPALLRRFRIIVVEFHRLEQLWGRPFLDLVSPVFRRLLSTHRCVHIHPNNTGEMPSKRGLQIPQAAEITFLRADRITRWAWAKRFPHPLDVDNVSGRPSLTLPSCWVHP